MIIPVIHHGDDRQSMRTHVLDIITFFLIILSYNLRKEEVTKNFTLYLYDYYTLGKNPGTTSPPNGPSYIGVFGTRVSYHKRPLIQYNVTLSNDEI